MEAKIQSFTQLNVWKQSHELVLTIYKVVNTFPAKELYVLSSQMLRAAISITSNIAEGFSRTTLKEKKQLYSISRGSLVELQNQLLLAKDLGYIEINEFQKLADSTIVIHKMLNALIKSIS